MTDKNHAPHAEHKDHEVEQHEVKQVLNFLTHYGKMIGVGVLAAAVVILISRGLSQRQANKMAQAEEMLATAQSPQQLERIIDEYGSTSAAPVALLDLAKTHFNDGDYFEARARYEQFLKDYKHHDLRPLADFGLASCTAADGDFNGAAELFAAFVEAHDGHFLQPLATLTLARSLKQANRPDEARILLEDFLAEKAESQWAGQATTLLEEVGEKQEL